MKRHACLSLIVAALAACAVSKPDPFEGWYDSYRTCRAEYAAVDARIDAAGVRDAGTYRVPGYPYLRTDRTLASFAHEVKSLDEIGGWIRHMRETDQEAREFEYINLGMNRQEAAIQRDRFLNCGRILASVEFLDQPAEYARLLAAVAPKDEYSSVRRALGLYPLAAPAMRAGIKARQQALDQAYAEPLDQIPADAPLQLWRAKPEADLSLVKIDFRKVLPDELGFPGFPDSTFRALAEYYAPQLWIETGSDADRLALPVLTQEGPAADPSQPQVHFHVTFARFGGKALVQINYLVWFKGADAHAPLDGFIWRVTFDEKMRPLIYESLHTSGRDHRWYPVQPLARHERKSEEHGIPVVAPQPAPAHLATLRIKAGTHEILRVVDAGAIPGNAAQTFEIRRYEDLFTLPAPGGGRHSLFGPDGLVPGPHGADPISGFASGIHEPGALRQLGRHAITPIGRAHFDDPFLLESVFVPPTTTAATASKPPG
jgi:hypothetical protein